MSTLEYLHKVLHQSLKNGERSTYEEVIMDGPKGVTIKLYKKEKGKVLKIVINGKADKFVMKTIKGDKTDSTDLTKAELVKEIKANKELKFAAEFMKTQAGGALFKKLSKKLKGAGKKRKSTKKRKTTKKRKSTKKTSKKKRKGTKKKSKRKRKRSRK